MSTGSPHIVVLGAGFGGLSFCKSYSGPGTITLVDRQNHHLFQPLLYQVAMAGLSATEVAAPIRSVFSRRKNITILMDEVIGIHLDKKNVRLSQRTLSYDYLVIALGGTTTYFGNPDWEEVAPGLKTLDDAMTMRKKILLSFERAENSDDEDERRRLTTIVVVGGGPTGVELAGAMAELRRYVFRRDFRRIDPTASRVVLVEGADRILGTFPESLSASAQLQLETLGVEVHTGKFVSDVTSSEVIFSDGSTIATANVLWSGGIVANPIVSDLLVDKDKTGRINVEHDLAIPGNPHVFAIGDIARVLNDGEPVPGVAPAAQQMGRFVARMIRDTEQNPTGSKERPAFQYFDKGTMATIGRRRAVAWIGKMKFGGLLAWWAWLAVHLVTLIGFRNKILVLIQWFYNYLSFSRGARIIVSSDTNDNANANEQHAQSDSGLDGDRVASRDTRHESLAS